MTIFELIKKVLDELYPQIEGNEDEKIQKIQDKIQLLSQLYANLINSSPEAPINYKDPITRFSYIYKYVTSHSDYVYSTIESYSEHFNNLGENIDVTCIGGGPGSDFLGILKYFIETEQKKNITCYIYDKEDAWGDNWGDVHKKTNSKKISLNTTYQRIDVKEKDSWSFRTKHKNSDIVTLIYFMSEIYKLRDQGATEFISKIFKESKSGCIFIFIDNMNSNLSEWFESIAASTNVEIKEKDDSKTYLSREEEKDELKEYIQKIKNSPKLNATTSIRIAIKK